MYDLFIFRFILPCVAGCTVSKVNRKFSLTQRRYPLRCHIYRNTSTLNSSAETGYLRAIRSSHLDILQEIDLPNLKGFEHRRVKNAKLTDLLRFAANAEVYSRSMTVKPCGLIDFFNPVSVRFGGVLCNFKVDDLALKTLFVGQESRSQHEQEAV